MPQLKKGRSPIVLDKKEFQEIVSNLEKAHNFNSLQELWTAVEQTEWAKTRQPRPLTAQVARLRARDLGIVIQTTKSDRPNFPQTKRVGGHRRRHCDPDAISALRATVPKSLHPLVDRVERGSLKTAIKLKCLDCSAYQPKEIRCCTLKKCPLWNFRPYQDKTA